MLVLGTLPGEESLRRQQYYAHPRNLFWAVIFALFGEASLPPSYEARVEFLKWHRIAVWDVVAAGQRIASADSTIRAELPNAIDRLLLDQPTLRAVAFNGSTARRLFDKHFARRPELRYVTLPSTSPAHARLDFAAKLAQWQPLYDIVTEP